MDSWISRKGLTRWLKRSSRTADGASYERGRCEQRTDFPHRADGDVRAPACSANSASLRVYDWNDYDYEHDYNLGSDHAKHLIY